MKNLRFKNAAFVTPPGLLGGEAPAVGKQMVKVFRTEGFKAGDATDEYPGGTLEGYASVFNNVDHGGDVVIPGAFKESVVRRLADNDLKLVDSHQIWGGTSAIIGKVHVCYEDAKGLFFKAFFSSVASAQDVRIKVKEGILDALSFGYFIEGMSESIKDGERTWNLEKLDIFEISVVGWGMNSLARITGAKRGLAAPADPPPSVKMATDAEIEAFIGGLRQVQSTHLEAKVLNDLRSLARM